MRRWACPSGSSSPAWTTATARTSSAAAWACSGARDIIYPEDDIRARYESAGRRDVVIGGRGAVLHARADRRPAGDGGRAGPARALLRPCARTFLTHMFPGSRRLLELADSITEIKTICECGAKATVNARIGPDGKIVTAGEQVFLGGNGQLCGHVPQVLAPQDKGPGRGLSRQTAASRRGGKRPKGKKPAPRRGFFHGRRGCAVRKCLQQLLQSADLFPFHT